MVSIVDDKEMVRELIHRHSYYLDRGEFDRWIGLYADDGLLDTSSQGVHRGRNELAAYARTLPSWRHLISNVLIQIDGFTAKASSYITIVDMSQASPVILYAGCYFDELIKRGDSWRLQSRTALTGPSALTDPSLF